MLSRRSLLKVAPLVLAAMGRPALARANTVRPAIRRRYFVQIVLSGGLDTLFFADPKEKSEVDPDVDVPFGPDQIFTAGGARFGPLMAPLKPWLPRTTVINGVTLGVANHPAGLRQYLRLHNGAVDEMPSLLELIGRYREGAALPSLALGNTLGFAYFDNVISVKVLSELDKTPPDELMLMARVMRQRSAGPAADRATKASIEATAQFFERLATTPRFEPKPDATGTVSGFSRDLQRAVWLIENDLSCGVVAGTGNWDTHGMNKVLQTKNTLKAMPAIAELLTALEQKKNRHGTLLDQTLVMIGSEIGRFPVLNRVDGKDHFPEAPMFIVNAASGGKVFGQTGKRMQALPFAGRRSGKVNLTDIGASVLRIAGINPETCGYDGEPLEILGA